MRVFIAIVIRFIVMGMLVFIPAGTIDFWQGWVFLSAFFVPIFFIVIYMLKNARGLLEKRLKIKEKRSSQKLIQVINTILSLSVMIIAGLDHRFGWSQMPVWAVIASVVVMTLAYLSFIRTMLENEYASRIIEIQEGQKVIDTGSYAVVRHPMYSSAIIMFMSFPLVLGSFWALIPLLPLPFMLILRIFDEEKALIKDLTGYKEYMKKVKYRLVPFLW